MGLGFLKKLWPGAAPPAATPVNDIDSIDPQALEAALSTFKADMEVCNEAIRHILIQVPQAARTLKEWPLDRESLLNAMRNQGPLPEQVKIINRLGRQQTDVETAIIKIAFASGAFASQHTHPSSTVA